MNQGYKPQNGHSKFSEQAIFAGAPHIALRERATGKVKLPHTYLFNEIILNELLKNISIYEELNFFDSMDLVYLERGENLYKPEDSVNYLYFPESAVVSEFQILEDGKTIEVSMTGREGIVGINALFNAQPTQNFTQVLIPGKALRINTQIAHRQMDGGGSFQKNVYQFVNQYLSQISQRVVCNNHHSTEERLCLWFLMLTERCSEKSLPLTQEQIARFLGVHRPSVTQVMQNLRNDGVIDYVRGKVSITSEQKLTDRACACHAAMARN